MEKEIKISRIIRETEDAITIELEKSDFLSDYASGQFLNVFMELQGELVSRSYSFSSSPVLGEAPAITVKKVPGGKLSGHLVETLSDQGTLRIGSPAGRFGLQEIHRDGPLVFIAGGSGITPLFSMIKTVLNSMPDKKAILIYGNRDENSIIFKEKLESLKKEYSEKFEVVYFLEQETSSGFLFNKGRITRSSLSRLLESHTQLEAVYLCGPSTMMESTEKWLLELGIEGSIIFKESYSPHLETDSTQKETGFSAITLIKGTEELHFEVEKDQPILKQVLDKGISLPHSCLEAMCGTCMVKVIKGKIRMQENYALTDKQLNEGYSLLCSGFANSDEVVLTYNN